MGTERFPRIPSFSRRDSAWISPLPISRSIIVALSDVSPPRLRYMKLFTERGGKRRRFPLLLNRVPPPSRPRLISLLVQRRRGVREILSRILHSRLRVPETRPIRESLLVRRDDERVSPLMERWNEISRISSLVSLYSRPNYFVFHSRANPVNHDDCLTRGMAVWENRRTMGERLEWVNGRMNDERWRERVQIWISDRKCSSHPYFKN